MSIRQLGNWTVTVTAKRIPVPSLTGGPDENWRYVDAAGHEHRWDNGYPTLRVVPETYWCNICHEEHTDSYLECPQCGEVIRPGLTAPDPYATVPGATHVELVYFDGQERRDYAVTTAEDADALMAATDEATVESVAARCLLTRRERKDQW